MQNRNTDPSGKASIDLNELTINSESELPDAEFTANLSYIEPGYKALTEHSKPSLSIASLILLRLGFKYTHVGMTVYVADDQKAPACITEFWPMSEHVPAGYLSTNGKRPISHAFRVESDQLNLLSVLRCIPRSLADQVRHDIASVVPNNIRQIFWSEGEIAQIEANAVAQHRYEKLAQELIDSLYE